MGGFVLGRDPLERHCGPEASMASLRVFGSWAAHGCCLLTDFPVGRRGAEVPVTGLLSCSSPQLCCYLLWRPGSRKLSTRKSFGLCLWCLPLCQSASFRNCWLHANPVCLTHGRPSFPGYSLLELPVLVYEPEGNLVGSMLLDCYKSTQPSVLRLHRFICLHLE